MSRGRIIGFVCCALMLPMLLAAKPASSRLFKDAESVELFSAIKNGDLEVKFIPKDATQATLLVENRTKKPLRIAMPATFAGVPVLAQDDGGFGGDEFGGGGGFDQGQNQQGQQAMGGGMGGMGGGMMGGGMGGGMMGGMMNVAPERTQKVKLTTVCLEHGKKDPNPRVAYKIVPLKAFTSDPHVHAVCDTLGRGKIDQASAQAAAWHFTDGLSLQQLANKVKIKHLNGTRTMYFNAVNLNRASRLVRMAKLRASKEAQKSPGETEEELSCGEEAEL